MTKTQRQIRNLKHLFIIIVSLFAVVGGSIARAKYVKENRPHRTELVDRFGIRCPGFGYSSEVYSYEYDEVGKDDGDVVVFSTQEEMIQAIADDGCTIHTVWFNGIEADVHRTLYGDFSLSEASEASIWACCPEAPSVD